MNFKPTYTDNNDESATPMDTALPPQETVTPTPDPEQWLTIRQAVRLTGFSESLLYKLITTRIIKDEHVKNRGIGGGRTVILRDAIPTYHTAKSSKRLNLEKEKEQQAANYPQLEGPQSFGVHLLGTEGWATVPEAARALNITASGIYRAQRAGLIRTRLVQHVKMEDAAKLANYLKGGHIDE